MKKDLNWDDVLIDVNFSEIESRSQIKLDHKFLDLDIKLPIMNANMDTIASLAMTKELDKHGAIPTMHRFETIEDNLVHFLEASSKNLFASVGIGKTELERAEALFDAGCTNFLIDVAHGANTIVVKQYDELRKILKGNGNIIVGNFANGDSIFTFKEKIKSKVGVDAWKLGIGGGSMCTTRVVTGCGRSTLASILSCSSVDEPLIADGGIRNSGDICKALVAGASAVMIGGMLAGTTETPGKMVHASKVYRGSASKESYESQGKVADHRTPEGEATTVLFKGPVNKVLQQVEAGIRSSMSYVGAPTLDSYRASANLVQVSESTAKHNHAYGKS